MLAARRYGAGHRSRTRYQAFPPATYTANQFYVRGLSNDARITGESGWECSFRLEKSQRYPILMCPRLEDLDQLDEKISWRSLSRAVLYDAVHQPPPVPPLGSVHRTGIGRGRRRRSSPGSRPLAPRSLPLRSTSRVRGAVRDDGGPQTGSNEVLYFDHITR